ncbi:hypothetical protein BKA82DRAFT_128628, partial [Pisolithus tinctorius]
TGEERTVVIRRLQGDDQFSASGEKLKCKCIKKSLTEWKTYVASESHYRANLMASTKYISYAIPRAWVSNNVEGSYKHSVSLVMVISWGNIQRAVSSSIYGANQTP